MQSENTDGKVMFSRYLESAKIKPVVENEKYLQTMINPVKDDEDYSENDESQIARRTKMAVTVKECDDPFTR